MWCAQLWDWRQGKAALQLFQKSFSRDEWPAIQTTGDGELACQAVNGAINCYSLTDPSAGTRPLSIPAWSRVCVCVCVCLIWIFQINLAAQAWPTCNQDPDVVAQPAAISKSARSPIFWNLAGAETISFTLHQKSVICTGGTHDHGFLGCWMNL